MRIHTRKTPAMKKPRPSLIKITILSFLAIYSSVLTFQFMHTPNDFQFDKQNFDESAKASALSSFAAATVAATTKKETSRALNYFVMEMYELSNILTKIDGHEDELPEDVMRFHGYLKCLKNVLLKEIPIDLLLEAMRPKELRLREAMQAQALGNSSQLPVWHNFKMSEMYEHHNCEVHAHDPNKTLTSPESWLRLRQLFWNFVGLPDAAHCEAGPHDFVFPYHARLSPGRGRGIFASRDIRVNETVHSGWGNTAFFQNGDTWRRFVMTLPTPEMSCDVMEWTWMQRIRPHSGQFVLCMDMDSGSLMNDGYDEWNSTVKRTKTDTSLDYVASRDIQKNEEIMFDYRTFLNEYSRFGL